MTCNELSVQEFRRQLPLQQLSTTESSFTVCEELCKTSKQQRMAILQWSKIFFLTFIAVLEVISLRIKPSVFTKQKPSQINFGLMKY